MESICSYSSAKEDEDIYKEIPDFSENGIKEFLLDQLNQRNFSRFTVDSNADHD